MAPFFPNLSTVDMALVNIALGFGFGFMLERAGFGNSTKLAAQFYLRDMSVLKVMFSAIITAMVLIFWSSALGILNFDKIVINSTHLWPEIIGGLLLGVGFIIGGYCPGTSIVSTSTLKIDGMVFLIGCGLGILVFGYTLDYYEAFWTHSGAFGALTLPKWLGLPDGVVVLGAVLMALGMFAGAEFIEGWLRRTSPDKRADQPEKSNQQRSKLLVGAAAFVVAGMTLAIYGQMMPNPEQVRLKNQYQASLDAREPDVSPPELIDSMHNNQLQLVILDIRDEAQYNLFHIIDSHRLDLNHTGWLETLNPYTVKVLVAQDSQSANQAWLTLRLQGVQHLYILEGGIDGWLDFYHEHYGHEHASSDEHAAHKQGEPVFVMALGANVSAADPPLPHVGHEVAYTRKITPPKPIVKPSGGCGG